MKLTKTEQFNIIIEEFNKRPDKTLDTYDEVLLERLNTKVPKTVQRIIEEFMLKHQSIVEVPGRRRKTYKLATPLDLFTESFDHFENIGWLFNMAHDSDPELFKELEHYTKKDKDLYLFKSSPFEDLSTLESQEGFKRLKRMIEARDYAKIKFFHNEEAFDNLRCLRLIFMDNNWYIAFIDSEEKLRLGRVSFIERVDYGTQTGHFQLAKISHQIKFLDEVQNSMTLYGVKKKIATIKANPNIARYFDKGMKTFLLSQRFKEKCADGSILFTLNYTQELEILPFIQKWLPDLIIVEPQELKDAYKDKLQKMIQNLNK